MAKRGTPEIWGLKGAKKFFFAILFLHQASPPPFKCLWTVPYDEKVQIESKYVLVEEQGRAWSSEGKSPTPPFGTVAGVHVDSGGTSIKGGVKKNFRGGKKWKKCVPKKCYFAIFMLKSSNLV